MISDDNEAKISKSLIKTDIKIKNKDNLKWKKKKKNRKFHTKKNNNKTKPARQS